MIPQSVFTLVSGGIFNAVLVPQIVRTLKEKDAQERLNRLITLAIGILLAMTVVMAAASPLLARLYVGSDDHQMIALTTSFTLWCMPQVFFYGLYTVLGQILAAKDHFLTYAWSSTGANIISCAGFTGFILLFSKANEQPLEFWTAENRAYRRHLDFGRGLPSADTVPAAGPYRVQVQTQLRAWRLWTQVYGSRGVRLFGRGDHQ